MLQEKEEAVEGEEIYCMLDKTEIFSQLKTSPEGLSEEEAKNRLSEYGENKIIEGKPVSKLKLFFIEFNSFLIYILLIAVVISGFLKEWIDASIIFAIIIFNAVLGFYQHYRAEKAIKALKSMLIPAVKVMRDGKLMEILSNELVPGDIIILSEGDKVMADARLIEVNELKINEAVLTGESLAVSKIADEVENCKTISERRNIVFMGTIVESGSAKAVVIKTGMATEFGKIARLLEEKKEETILQKKLNKFAKQIGIFCIVLIGLIFIFQLLLKISRIEAFMTSVSLAVAAIPEGLPAVITLCLAFAVNRMLKVKALIRRLPAAETLGRVTVICTDKTGTLTKEELKVSEIYSNGKNFSVLTKKEKEKFLQYLEKSEEAKMFIKTSCLASRARLNVEINESNREEIQLVGDNTEKALILFAHDLEMRKSQLTKSNPLFKEFMFNSQRKMMSVIRKENDELTSYVKGSPEIILKLCSKEYLNGRLVSLSEQRRQKILDEFEIMAQNALRVLAFAYKKIENKSREKITEKEAESDLIFLGLEGMFDAPREEVKGAIEKCISAGISVKMITGDSLLTARAVAAKIGLTGNAMEGIKLKELSDDELSFALNEYSIFARTDPEDKARIVSILKTKNEIVAVTGDGINDAPALKKADIGIAMGIRGSDVTRETADIILLDDNFNSIVKAVEEGRVVYDNIKKFTYYLLSSNFAEILIILSVLILSSSLGWKVLLPLIPIQLLWINLVTDGMIAINLSVSKPEHNVMRRKPEQTEILTRKTMLLLSAVSLWITLGMIFLIWKNSHDVLRAQTFAFTSLVIFEGFNAFNFSSFNLPVHKRKINFLLIASVVFTGLLQLAIIYTPFLQKIFNTTALSFNELLFIGLIGATILIAGEIVKIIRHKSINQSMIETMQ